MVTGVSNPSYIFLDQHLLQSSKTEELHLSIELGLNEISYAIEKILIDEFLRKNIASNAYKFANEFFSLDKIIKQYIEFYNK